MNSQLSEDFPFGGSHLPSIVRLVIIHAGDMQHAMDDVKQQLTLHAPAQFVGTMLCRVEADDQLAFEVGCRISIAKTDHVGRIIMIQMCLRLIS